MFVRLGICHWAIHASLCSHTVHSIEMSTVKGERFGQRPPPISKLIRSLLDKYPSGQIFKV